MKYSVFTTIIVFSLLFSVCSAADRLVKTMPDNTPDTSTADCPKTVGIFYFLWNGFQGDKGPYDVTKILTDAPNAIRDANHPLWGPMKTFHHWGEPVFGYYAATDDYVIRKHAQMLSDAGVDVIIFDVTNQRTYPESYRAICRVFTEERKKGNRTPQIAFFTPFGRPTRAVLPLWNDFYSKGDYSALWFRWKGKPLIIADPDAVMPEKQDFVFPDKELVPTEIKKGMTLGQSFTVDRPLKSVAVRTPTWYTSGAGATLLLRKDNPSGKELMSKEFSGIDDNAWLKLTVSEPLPPGKYYLEFRYQAGRIGWWGVAESGRIPEGEAYQNGKPCKGTRLVRITRIPEDPVFDKILDFFTFRKMRGYTQGPSGPNQWSWLQEYPQYGFYSEKYAPDTPNGKPKKVEQMSVSVAQNIVDGRMGVISSPRAHGRSFHNGKQPPPEQCDFTGKNYAEQWQRVFELDTEFVFITGWNEWIMMRFPKDAPFHGASESEVNFVDQFNHEFSRDIEPMKGWHEDAFYYQTVDNIRRFKGTPKTEPVSPKLITVDGKFDDWKYVKPEFFDTVGDEAKRNHRGWAKDSVYKNETGRNDFIAAKFSYGKKMLYFYAKTSKPITGQGKPNWMLLYIDIDANSATGWLGYDFMVENNVLKKNVDGKYRWDKVADVKSAANGNEYEVAVPMDSAGLNEMPKSVQFKFADNILQTGDWSDFTLNGDAAPNDRFNYSAVITESK